MAIELIIPIIFFIMIGGFGFSRISLSGNGGNMRVVVPFSLALALVCAVLYLVIRGLA